MRIRAVKNLLAIGMLVPCLLSAPLMAQTSKADSAQELQSAALQLDNQLSRVSDINEIKRLQRIYGYYLDRSEWEEVADLLTEDASAEYGLSGLYKGKAQVRKLLYAIGYGKRGLMPEQLREHMQLQPVITLSADGMSAKGRWRLLGLLGQYKEYARWQTGPYEVEYRKVEGRWHINKLHWKEDFTVPYAGGWAARMEQTNVADRDIPAPDAPPSFSYEPWPVVSHFPYHFENPVSHPPASPPTKPTSTELSGSELRQQLADMQQEVELLEAERDIEILQRTYGYYVDKNLWTQIRDLFAPTGTLEIGGRGVFVGQDRALEYLQWLGEPVQGRLYDHTQMQGVVHVSPDGKTARGRWRALVFGGDHGRASVFGDCIYENEYVKENGVWKISRLRAYFIMYTMFEQGWHQFALPNTRPEFVIPPDQPPSMYYEMFPGTLTAPYHYDNPVTGRPNFPGSFTPDLTALSSDELRELAADLTNRTSQLDDMQQVERLQNAFGYYFDERNWNEVSLLFADDAMMERGQRGVYAGRDSITRSLPLYGEPGLQQGNVHQNIYYQHVIHVDDDGQGAKARFRTLNLYGDYQQEATLAGGVFENAYVKQDGIWKLGSDHLYTTFIADYSKGWANGARAVPGISADLPPDLPPSFEYEAFPTYYLFPFHYNNPVSGAAPY